MKKNRLYFLFTPILCMLLVFSACGRSDEVTPSDVVPVLASNETNGASSNEPNPTESNPTESNPTNPTETNPTETNPTETNPTETTPDLTDIVPDLASYDFDGVPLMWRVTSPAGQTMYLFGSIHAADETVYPLPDFIMDAFHRSDYLAVEADIVAHAQGEQAMMAMSTRFLYTDGRTIRDDIGADLYERASKVMEELGYHVSILDGFKPYIWSSFLLAEALNLANMVSDLGIDDFFILEAMARGMGILEVESIEKQMDLLLGLSMEMQALLLEGSLDIALVAEGLLMLFEAWQQGNEEWLVALFEMQYDYMPAHLFHEYNQSFLVQRDIGMTQAARQYMAEGKQVFFVVGLGHMVGDNSIVYLLRNYGYDVVRVLPD